MLFHAYYTTTQKKSFVTLASRFSRERETKKILFHCCLFRCRCGIVGVVVSSLFVVSWCRCGIVVVVVLWLSLWYCVVSLFFVWLCCCCLYGCVVVVLLLFIAVVSLLFIVVVSLLFCSVIVASLSLCRRFIVVV